MRLTLDALETLDAIAEHGSFDSQETLIVPSLGAKLAAQLAGLGVGFLPRYLAAPHVACGELVLREVETPRPAALLHLAWRGGDEGRALAWFRERVLGDAALAEALGGATLGRPVGAGGA